MNANTDFQIEKNVPIPPQIRGKAGEIAMTLGRMDVGDSFVFDDNEKKAEQISIKYAAEKLGIRMTVRKIGDLKYRAWRVK